jgi:hypothetical protein
MVEPLPLVRDTAVITRQKSDHIELVAYVTAYVGSLSTR